MEILEDKEPVKENHGTLYLTISVFLVILSFFILMNSISTANTQKTSKITTALKKEFLEKPFNEEIKMFDKRKYEQDTGEKTVTFKDILVNFQDAQKKNVDSALSESPTQYIVSVTMNSFFGFNNNSARPPAVAYINSLNNYIELNKKNPAAQAKLVIIYNAKNQSDVFEKLKSLYASLNGSPIRNVTFSATPVSKNNQKAYLNNVYILFDKNEF